MERLTDRDDDSPSFTCYDNDDDDYNNIEDDDDDSFDDE